MYRGNGENPEIFNPKNLQKYFFNYGVEQKKTKYFFLICLFLCGCNAKQKYYTKQKNLDTTFHVSYLMQTPAVFTFEIKNKKLMWASVRKSHLKDIYETNNTFCCFTKDSVDIFSNYYEKILTDDEFEMITDTLDYYIKTYKKKDTVVDHCYSNLIIYRNNTITSQKDEKHHIIYKFILNFILKNKKFQLINKPYKFEAYFQDEILSKSLPHAPLIPD